MILAQKLEKQNDGFSDSAVINGFLQKKHCCPIKVFD